MTVSDFSLADFPGLKPGMEPEMSRDLKVPAPSGIRITVVRVPLWLLMRAKSNCGFLDSSRCDSLGMTVF